MNFKFLHAADIHLDSPLIGLKHYEGMPIKTVQQATRRALENMVNVAIEQTVDFVLLAGDIYDGDWKDFNTGRFFALQMDKLAKAKIRVFMVKGNHDAESQIAKKISLPANVHVFSHGKARTEKIDELQVAIHGQSFARRDIKDNLSVGYPDKIHDWFNIGLLHTMLAGEEGHDNYAPCALSDLQAKKYDYWALGHVHQHKIVSRDPYVVFSGCLQGRKITETGNKGATLVEVKDGEITATHRELDVVRWKHIQVKVEGAADTDIVSEKIREEVKQGISEDRLLVTRISINGTTNADANIRQRRDEFRQDVLRVLDEFGDGNEACLEKLCINTKMPIDNAKMSDIMSLVDEVLSDDDDWLNELKQNIKKFPLSVTEELEENSLLKKILQGKSIAEDIKNELRALLGK